MNGVYPPYLPCIPTRAHERDQLTPRLIYALRRTSPVGTPSRPQGEPQGHHRMAVAWPADRPPGPAANFSRQLLNLIRALSLPILLPSLRVTLFLSRLPFATTTIQYPPAPIFSNVVCTLFSPRTRPFAGRSSACFPELLLYDFMAAVPWAEHHRIPTPGPSPSPVHTSVFPTV